MAEVMDVIGGGKHEQIRPGPAQSHAHEQNRESDILWALNTPQQHRRLWMGNKAHLLTGLERLGKKHLSLMY
jgi:hypothetical protein